MTFFRIYTMLLDTRAGEILKGILDGLFPGLLKEPRKVPVRVPVSRPENGRRQSSR